MNFDQLENKQMNEFSNIAKSNSGIGNDLKNRFSKKKFKKN